MNKIDELKKKLAYKAWPLDTGFNLGWEAAMELQLPVLFHKWANELDVGKAEQIEHFMGNVDDTTLYQYWILNIYQPKP